MKPFFGYKDKEHAKQYWPETVLNTGVISTREQKIVDDPTTWPQTRTKTEIITTVEHPQYIISY